MASPQDSRDGSEEERFHEALLGRAEQAIDAAAQIVAESEVLAHVVRDLRRDGMTRRCAWCGRHRIGDRWMLLDASLLIDTGRTTHTICEDCVETLRRTGLSV